MEIILKFKLPEEAEEYELITNCHDFKDFVNELTHYFNELHQNTQLSKQIISEHFLDEFIRLQEEYGLPL